MMRFYKLSASGNDFIIMDNRSGILYKKFSDLTQFAKLLCRRNLSVGADGLILIENSNVADFSSRFFNSDGTEAEMCGNGGRCVARVASELGIAKSKMSFETKAGIIEAQVNERDVRIKLSDPHSLRLDYKLRLGDEEYTVSSVNTGVPHAVLIVDDIERAPVYELGRRIRFHDAFSPRGTNVNFVKVISRNLVQIRTYERGVEDETYACGTGAVASSIVLKEKGLIDLPVTLKTRGGEDLKVHIDGGVFLEGPVRFILEGTLREEALFK